MRALLDRVSGKRRRIAERNERETLLAYQRDVKERDTLIFQQLDTRRALQARMERLQSFARSQRQAMIRDRELYQDVRDNRRDAVDFSVRRPTQDFEPGM